MVSPKAPRLEAGDLMHGKTTIVDKIRMLLEVARSAGDTAEGRAARRIAEEKLAREGLTEGEVLADRKVAIGGRVAIWEQALMEISAEISLVGLEVNRETTEWTLKGPRKHVDEAVDRFHGLRAQLLDASLDYLGLVREGMRAVGDDPTLAKSTLDRMRLVFLEAASISVFGRLLERLLADGDEAQAQAQAQGFAEPEEAPSRKRTAPFEKLLERFSNSEDIEWDFEIDVADGVPDPSTAGNDSGLKIVIDAPFPGRRSTIGSRRKDRQLVE